jgi:excisionase family DNA binding protein
LLWSTYEVAAALNVSARTVKLLIACGALPSIKIGTRRRVRRIDVLAAVKHGIPRPDAVQAAADQGARP